MDYRKELAEMIENSSDEKMIERAISAGLDANGIDCIYEVKRSKE